MEFSINHLRRFSSIAALAMLGVLGSLDTARAQAIVVSSSSVTVNAVSNGSSGTNTIMLSITSSTSTFMIASSSNCGSGCLATNPSQGTLTTTPQNILVIVNPTGVGAGTYSGTLTITGPSVTNSPQTVQVTINISASGNTTIQVSPNPLPTFNFASGSSITSTQQLSVFSVGGNGTANFSDSFQFTGGPVASNFVTLDISGGTVPPTATINATAHPAGLPDGTYTGIIYVTPNNGTLVQVSVTMIIGSISGVSANPPSLTFNVTAGAASQTTQVTISNTTGSAVTLTPSVFTNSCGGGWLSETPSTAFTIQPSTTAFINITVNPGSLANGNTCQGGVTLTPGAGSGTLTIPVTVNVGTGGTGSLGLAVFPSSLTMSAAPGTVQSAASLQVTTTSSSAAISAAASTTNGNSTWLSVSPAFANFTSSVPANLTVFADPTNLVVGTYNGNITITGQAFNGGTIVVPVTFTVGGSGGSAPFTVMPTSLSVTIPSGSTTPVSQTLQVTTASASNVGVTATASTNGTGNWLAVNPPNLQQVSSTTPLTYTVSVSPAAFVGTGPFSGNVILTPQNGSSAILVPVAVTVGNATLKVTPSQLNFAWQTGTALPAAQSLTLTSTGGAVAYSAQATTTSGGAWLIINPVTGSTGANGTPTTMTVSVNPNGLTPGVTYSGNIAISGGNSTVNIGVSLLVSSLPILALSTSQVTFNYQFQSSTLPPAQTVQVTSSGNPVSFTTSVDTSGAGGAFVTVTPSSGTTPQPLSLTLNATQLATLAPGTYTTNVTLTAGSAGNSPVTLKVTLIVGNNNLLNASQGSLSFNYQIGQGAPPIQTLNITSSGQPLVYSVTATSTNCGNFLSVSPGAGTTPGSVGVMASIAGLTTPATCTGVVHIASNSANVGNSPLDVPVTLYVSNSALLNVSPSAISVTTTVGSNPSPITVGLTSTDSTTLSFSVTSQTNDGISWLLVGPTGGSTPTNVNVGFSAAGLPAKTYTGSITIASTGPANAPVVLPVTLTVTSMTTASVTPASLTFTQAFGAGAPGSQTLQVTSSTAGLTFSASGTTFNGGNWLTVTGNGTTPGSVTVSANGSTLAQGTYNGFVTITIPGASNSPIQVGATLVVGPPQTLVIGASSLTFNYTAGSGNTPPAQTVSVTSSGGNVPFTATSSGTFVTVTPGSGNTPGSLSIGMNQSVLATLTPGPYTGTVTVASPGLPSQTITINLTVAAQPAPVINAVVNGASMLQGELSPGEIITLFGTNLGPTPAQTLMTTSSGMVSTNLGNTTVTFDNSVLAPLIYASSGQINAIVPYEMAGRFSVSIVVTRNGVASQPVVYRMGDTSPAPFTLTQTGSGQGAILNQNNTVNGASNPESKGRVIAIYATGEGLLTPAAVTGTFTGSTPPFPRPVAVPVSVTIGGQPATVTYAGEAPTLVSGVLQVNAIIPTSIVGSGPMNVFLTVGANTSTQLVTVAVQ